MNQNSVNFFNIKSFSIENLRKTFLFYSLLTSSSILNLKALIILIGTFLNKKKIHDCENKLLCKDIQVNVMNFIIKGI